jgi:hypothetical protein
VEFVYNASRALGIEHTPFEANFGFFHEEPLNLLFSMRPSIFARRIGAGKIVTGSTYPGTRCVTATQGRDASAHKTVYITTLRQRRQGVGRHNKHFFCVDSRIGNSEIDSLALLQWRSKLLGNTVRD